MTKEIVVSTRSSVTIKPGAVTTPITSLSSKMLIRIAILLDMTGSFTSDSAHLEYIRAIIGEAQEMIAKCLVQNISIEWSFISFGDQDCGDPGPKFEARSVVNINDLQQALATARHYNGGGNGYECSLDPINTAVENLRKGDIPLVVILVTDDYSNGSNESGLTHKSVESLLQHNQTVLFAIGVYGDENLQALAVNTHGAYAPVKRTPTPDEMKIFFSLIMGKILSIATAFRQVSTGGASAAKVYEQLPSNAKPLLLTSGEN